MVFYICRYGRGLRSYPSPSLDGDKSIRFQKTKVSTTIRENQWRDPTGSKQIKGGAYAPNEYGSSVLYEFRTQYSKWMQGAAHTRTVNYEIRDPALRVGGG